MIFLVGLTSLLAIFFFLLFQVGQLLVKEFGFFGHTHRFLFLAIQSPIEHHQEFLVFAGSFLDDLLFFEHFLLCELEFVNESAVLFGDFFLAQNVFFDVSEGIESDVFVISHQFDVIMDLD